MPFITSSITSSYPIISLNREKFRAKVVFRECFSNGELHIPHFGVKFYREMLANHDFIQIWG